VGIEVEEFAGVRRRQHRAGTDTHPACVGGLARSLRCPSRLTGWPLVEAAATPRAPQITTTITSPHKVVVNGLELTNVAGTSTASSRATQANTEGAWVRRPRSSDRTPSASPAKALTARKQPSVTPVGLSVVPLRGAHVCVATSLLTFRGVVCWWHWTLPVYAALPHGLGHISTVLTSLTASPLR
jgi:hypothetical protein